ncbi:hypothetical protein ACWDLS_31605, partial [Nocardia rhamnosiphila]
MVGSPGSTGGGAAGCCPVGGRFDGSGVGLAGGGTAARLPVGGREAFGPGGISPPGRPGERP